ncbi:hypothetical protein [Kitasatospora sp. NPDC004531]
MATPPKGPEAREQILALAQRLRHDPDFLAQVEAVINGGKETDNIDLNAFTLLFTRDDVVEALQSIRHSARAEHLDGKDLVALMPRSEDALSNGVAAAIVAAAAATAAAAAV